MIIAKESGTDYPVLPVGNYPAVCYAVWDLGLQQGSYQGKPTVTHKIIIAWEVSEKMETADKYNGKRYVVTKWYTLSLGKKSNLRPDLESWRGKEFTAEECKSFDVETLIGTNCLLNIIHDEKGRAKVSSIAPLLKGIPLMMPENKTAAPAWVIKFIEKALTMEQASEVLAESHSIQETSEVPF